MEPQLFTDGIGRITVIGGVVRLDMVTYSPNDTDAQGRPRQVFTQRIVMGTDAFLRSSEKIVQIVQQLTAAIAAQPKAPPQPAQSATQRPAAPQPSQPSTFKPAVAPAPAAAPPAAGGEPPYVTGPLFPATPPQPPKAPFP
jgi:hypothetical protein